MHAFNWGNCRQWKGVPGSNQTLGKYLQVSAMCQGWPEDRQHQVSTEHCVGYWGTLFFYREPGGCHSYLDLCSLAKSIGLYLLQARCLLKIIIILFLFDVQVANNCLVSIVYCKKMGKKVISLQNNLHPNWAENDSVPFTNLLGFWTSCFPWKKGKRQTCC